MNYFYHLSKFKLCDSSVLEFLYTVVRLNGSALVGLLMLGWIWSGCEASLSYVGSLEVLSLHQKAVYVVGVWMMAQIALRLQGFLGALWSPHLAFNVRQSLWRQLIQCQLEVPLPQKIFSISSCVNCVCVLFEHVLYGILMPIGFLGASIFVLYSVDPMRLQIVTIWVTGHSLVTLYAVTRLQLHSGQVHRLSIALSVLEQSIYHNWFKTQVGGRGFEVLRRMRRQQFQVWRAACRANLHVEWLLMIQSIWLFMCVFYTVLSWTQGVERQIGVVACVWFQLVHQVWSMGARAHSIVQHYGALKVAWSTLGLSQRQRRQCRIQSGVWGIHLKRVGVVRGVQSVLEDINLSIFDQSSMALSGASGAGKSTLLRVLGGVEMPTSGDRIWTGPLFGRVGIHRQIMLLPQVFSVSSESILSVIQNWSDLHVLVDDILEIFKQIGWGDWLNQCPYGLATRLDQDVRFSKGEIEVLAMIGVCLSRQKMVLLDEPLTGVDSLTASALWNVFLNHWKGRVWVLASHQPQLLHAADRHFRLFQGRLQVLV